MSILFLLIVLSIVLLMLAVGFFFWASSDGQYDDLDSPAVRILMDDDERPVSHIETDQSNESKNSEES